MVYFLAEETGERARSDRARAFSTGPRPSLGWGRSLVVLGAVTFTSGGFLAAMFISLAQGHSASPWGPINDALGAVSNLMLAAAIPMLSRRAVRLRWERVLVPVVSGVSVMAGISGVLLVLRLLAFAPSTAISMVAIVLQMLWMLWLNRRYADDPEVPMAVHRFGTVVAVTLLAGLALVGASFVFPWGSAAAYALLIPGIVGGGIAWLGWPAWYVLVGRHLSHRPDGDPTQYPTQ